MRVLLTGRSGYISKAISSAFERSNHELCPISLRNSSDFNNLPIGIDAIIHTAAISNANSNNFEALLNANFELTKKLYLFYKEKGLKHFLFFSSLKASFYDNVILDDQKLTDIDSPYGFSKAKAEFFLNNHKDNVIISIIRPSMVYSNYPKSNMQILLNLCDSGIPLPFGNIHVKREICNLKNLVDLTMHLVDNPQKGIFTISDLYSPTLTKLVEQIRFELGRKRLLFSFPKILKSIVKFIKPNIYSNLFVENEFCDINLPSDFVSTISACEGIKMMVKCYKSNK